MSEASVNATGIAGEAMTAARFVDLQSDGTVDMADAAANIPLGLSAEAVAAGVNFPITTRGRGMIELGATLSAGVLVSAGADGVAAAASAVGGEFKCGPLIQGGVSGDIVEIELNFYTVNA